MSKREVDGLVVAITGGAQGIGRQIALQLASEGAKVSIGDIDHAAAQATAAELPGDVLALPLDVTNNDSFSEFLTSTAKVFGPVDVLVNNAGIMWVGSFDSEPESWVSRQFEVNVFGVIRGIKLAAPIMRTRGKGQIVTIASAASKFAPPGQSTYAATKHAVHGYVTGVRSELRKSGVTVTLIMPAVVQTDLAAGTSAGATKLLQPTDVANAVVDAIKKPRFEIYIPGRLAALAGLAGVLPRPAKDLLFSLLLPDQVKATEDKSARAEYEERNS